MKKNVTTVSFLPLHDYETAGAVLGNIQRLESEFLLKQLSYV